MHAALEVSTTALRQLEDVVPRPQWVRWKTSFNWRCVEKLPSQAIVQKIARQISGAKALDLLLEHGFLQEVGVMQRMLDEIAEDVSFLALGMTTGLNKDHEKYLRYFWAEDEPDLLNVKRSKIRAFNHRALNGLADPSGADKNARDLYQTFSDFVHARSSSIMAMVAGPPPTFHIDGILDEEATLPFREQAPTYGFRCLCSLAFATRAIEDGPVADQTFRELVAFEDRYRDLVLSGA